MPSVSIGASEGAQAEVLCFSRADGRPDAFNMGSLRTELHIPAAFQSAHSIEECPETDEDSDEDADGGDDEDVMVLGSTPQVHAAAGIWRPNLGWCYPHHQGCQTGALRSCITLVIS